MTGSLSQVLITIDIRSIRLYAHSVGSGMCSMQVSEPHLLCLPPSICNLRTRNLVAHHQHVESFARSTRQGIPNMNASIMGHGSYGT